MVLVLFVLYLMYGLNLKTETYIPILRQYIELPIFAYIPFAILVILATTNAVNLTDGLDGLASSTTFAYLISFVSLMLILFQTIFLGYDGVQINELNNLLIVACISAGAMLSFLVFNCFPAKIFMGDTGSLALGSLVASVCVFSRMSLYIPIFGIMFVMSSVSVILQVAYYKLTKKRIFLMAPLHHHFQMKGVHEVRITICYTIITLLVGAMVVIINTLI